MVSFLDTKESASLSLLRLGEGEGSQQVLPSSPAFSSGNPSRLVISGSAGLAPKVPRGGGPPKM